MTRSPLVAATAVTTLLAALALSSCSAEDLVERAAERSIENAAGGEADIDFDADSGSFSVDTEEGSFSTGTSLPDDFPDDIPLVDGEVMSAASADDQGQRGFLVVMYTDGSPEEAAAEAVSLLEAAGFAETEDLSAMTGLSAAQLGDDTYEVLVSAYPAADQTALQYTITVV